MNSMSLAIRALAFAAAVNLTPAAAQTAAPQNTTGSNVPQIAYGATSQHATGAPHWEWQYHYTGRHARYEGHWVLVR
jgi:hypothetical protein